MISKEDLQSLASLYEEYMFAADPTLATVRQAKLLFDHECRQLLEQETLQLQTKMKLDVYQAGIIIPQILEYLRTIKKYPTV